VAPGIWRRCSLLPDCRSSSLQNPAVVASQDLSNASRTSPNMSQSARLEVATIDLATMLYQTKMPRPVITADRFTRAAMDFEYSPRCALILDFDNLSSFSAASGTEQSHQRGHFTRDSRTAAGPRGKGPAFGSTNPGYRASRCIGPWSAEMLI